MFDIHIDGCDKIPTVITASGDVQSSSGKRLVGSAEEVHWMMSGRWRKNYGLDYPAPWAYLWLVRGYSSIIFG
jgi:hypothetical protein